MRNRFSLNILEKLFTKLEILIRHSNSGNAKEGNEAEINYFRMSPFTGNGNKSFVLKSMKQVSKSWLAEKPAAEYDNHAGGIARQI